MLTKRQNRWLVIGVLAEMALMIAAGIIMGLPSMARGEELPKHPFTVISDQPDRVKMFYFMAKGDKASTAELKVAEALAKKYNWDMTTYDVLGSTGDASVKASFKVRGVPTFVFKRLGPDGWMRSKDDWLAVEGAVPMEEVVKILEKKNFIPSPPASAEAEPKQAPPAVAYTPEKDLPRRLYAQIGRDYPHISINNQKLDYDKQTESYYYAGTQDMAMISVLQGSWVLNAQLKQDPQTGKWLRRTPDGRWVAEPKHPPEPK
jgi:hypothetical protein